MRRSSHRRPVTFTVPATSTRAVMTDVAPGGAYSVQATPSGGNLAVTIQSGNGFTASASGVLHVVITATGGVTPGS